MAYAEIIEKTKITGVIKIKRYVKTVNVYVLFVPSYELTREVW